MDDSIGNGISKSTLWKLSKMIRQYEDETKEQKKEKNNLEIHGIGEWRDTLQWLRHAETHVNNNSLFDFLLIFLSFSLNKGRPFGFAGGDVPRYQSFRAQWPYAPVPFVYQHSPLGFLFFGHNHIYLDSKGRLDQTMLITS